MGCCSSNAQTYNLAFRFTDKYSSIKPIFSIKGFSCGKKGFYVNNLSFSSAELLHKNCIIEEYRKHLSETETAISENNEINFESKSKIGGFFLGNLEIINSPCELQKDFFLAKQVIFHAGYGGDIFEFPKCKYNSEKIKICINDDHCPNYSPILHVCNENCPVEIEIFIHGKNKRQTGYNIICQKPDLIKIVKPEKTLIHMKTREELDRMYRIPGESDFDRFSRIINLAADKYGYPKAP